MKLFKGKKGHGLKAHIIIGLSVLAVLWYFNNQYKWIELPTDTLSLVMLVLVGIVYSNMADCDQPGSITNKYITTFLVGVIIWAFYKQQTKYGIIAAVILGLLRWIEHRKCIHSIVGGLIISAPLYYFGLIYFIVGFVAFMSHIVADGEVSFFMEKDLW